MDQTVTHEDVLKSIREFLENVPADDISLDVSLEELGVDSLGQVELATRLEERYEVDLTGKDADMVETVRAVVDVVMAQVAK